MKTTDFLNESFVEDAGTAQQDHEVQMARADLFHAAEDALALHKMLRHVSESAGLEGWVSAKITLAADYLNTVREYMEYQLMTGAPAEPAAEVIAVAEAPEDNPVVNAITRRIMMQHTDLLSKYGPELVGSAIDEVADYVGDVEEIGSSDVSGWVRQVERMLKENPPEAFGLSEAQATEDVISTVKKKLGDYLADLSKEIKTDSDLKDKVPQDADKIGPAVKTIVTDDGREIKIHGNEDDGFRITIKNKPHSARFESLDHATMACEMYMNRKRKMREQVQNEDYLEEQK